MTVMFGWLSLWTKITKIVSSLQMFFMNICTTLLFSSVFSQKQKLCEVNIFVNGLFAVCVIFPCVWIDLLCFYWTIEKWSQLPGFCVTIREKAWKTLKGWMWNLCFLLELKDTNLLSMWTQPLALNLFDGSLSLEMFRKMKVCSKHWLIH